VRSRVYLAEERKSIGEAIEQLAAVDQGFDFDFDSAWLAGTITTTFETTYPNSGRSTSYVFELGTNVSIMSISTDGTTLATSVEAIGAGIGDEAVIGRVTDSSLHTDYPLLEVIDNYNDIRKYETLQEHAQRRLNRGSRPIQSVTLNVFSDTIPTLGSYKVGDLVEVRGSYGLIVVDATFRIMDVNVAIDANGTESITMNLAQKAVF